MNPKSANSSPTNNPARCGHRFANGARCRLPVRDPDSLFCPRHAKLPQNHREPADLAASLTAGLSEFNSAVPINDFLSLLLLLLSQNRISPRRAAVLAYITNQLLRTLSAMEKEAENDDPKNIAPKIIWDIPRPERDQRDQPSCP